jgi:hypothetical protein
MYIFVLLFDYYLVKLVVSYYGCGDPLIWDY